LTKNVQDWFRKLPQRFVNSLKALRRKFLTQLLARRRCKKPSGYLLIVTQGPNESLKENIMRFNQEKLSSHNPIEEMAFVALYRGIQADRPLMEKLASKQPTSLQEFMDKAEEFIKQEEKLRAIISSRQPQVSVLEASEDSRGVETIDFKP
jgi:hypothetical protein